MLNFFLKEVTSEWETRSLTRSKGREILEVEEEKTKGN